VKQERLTERRRKEKYRRSMEIMPRVYLNNKKRKKKYNDSK